MSRPLPSSFDGNSDFYEESRIQKLLRRLKEEPLIPLGCILTSWALFSASRSIRAGDHNRTNRMFRARIYAQGFTVAAMVAGSIYWQTDRQKQKELDKLIEERKAQVKRAKWLEELDYRDREAKEEQARRESARVNLVAVNSGISAQSDALTQNHTPSTGEVEKKGVIESLNELASRKSKPDK
ncbi:Respiratory supercomplex factor 1, mitochondrial [Golovinomyces cichoracearum]|uniref:Respiratory supercomplex factor 1, mitochondrial n=1 Tax=Golovinomyces cichoracearum TaxID=62708 RepID=A0A420H8E5_9PEZI|nr:Respiratory supercomplex factor 1, mitochondrial [Golovinomyces cichoracearum]